MASRRVSQESLTTRTEDRPRGPAWILFSPRRAFLGVRDKPRAVALALVLSLLAALPGVAFVRAVDLGAFLDKQMRASGQMRNEDEMPQEAKVFLEEKLPKLMAVVIPLGAAGKRAGWILVVGLLGFAFLRGAYPSLRMSQALAAVALATTPLLLADLLKAALFLVRDPLQLDVNNPLLSNPAAWLGLSSERSVPGAGLARFDLFELWSLALTAIGLNTVAGARSRAPWLLVSVVWTLLLVSEVAGAAVAAAKLS